MIPWMIYPGPYLEAEAAEAVAAGRIEGWERKLLEEVERSGGAG